jgi:hypothetical protein
MDHDSGCDAGGGTGEREDKLEGCQSDQSDSRRQEAAKDGEREEINMTKDQYWQCVKQAIRDHPEWRTGQAAFNVLFIHRRDLSEQIRGTDIDPFYVRDRNFAREIPAEFRKWVEAHWDDTSKAKSERLLPLPDGEA